MTSCSPSSTPSCRCSASGSSRTTATRTPEARIDALWATLRADLAADHPELLPGFQAVVDLAGSAVTRRRPADADKARLNAEALIAAASG